MPPRIVVTQDEINAIFNEGRYYDRARAGEFTAFKVADGRVRRSRRRERGDRSQIWHYQDHYGTLIAIVHQYRRRDGSIGGKGRCEPKYLFHEGVIYTCRERVDWDLPVDWG